MNLEADLKAIKAEYDAAMHHGQTLTRIYQRVEQGTASYSEACAFSNKSGKVIADILDRYLSKNLVDQRVTQEVAEALVPGALKHNHALVAEVCEKVQANLNEKAGLNLRALKPYFDDRRAGGLVTEIVNAENYPDKRAAFLDQVENLSMSAVDKSVRVNADFHYKAGMAPKIKRIAVGKCCKWCSKLEGVYDYEDVKDTGNAVFRRHSNCHCRVIYVPTRGRAQDVHTKEILRENEVISDSGKRGKVLFDSGYKKGKNRDEIDAANWLAKSFGGNVTLLTNKYDRPTPDFKWDEKFWDLKTPKGTNGVDNLVKHGLRQISEKPGGILLDCSAPDIDIEKAIKLAQHRLNRSSKSGAEQVIVRRNGNLITVLHPNKKG